MDDDWGGLIGILSLIVFIGLGLWMFDTKAIWSDEAISYTFQCTIIDDSGECLGFKYTLPETSYKVHENRNEVTYLNVFEGVKVLKNCIIHDRENWVCRFADDSGEVKFSDGIGGLVTDSWKHVSKFDYRIQQIKSFFQQ